MQIVYLTSTNGCLILLNCMSNDADNTCVREVKFFGSAQSTVCLQILC